MRYMVQFSFVPYTTRYVSRHICIRGPIRPGVVLLLVESAPTLRPLPPLKPLIIHARIYLESLHVAARQNKAPDVPVSGTQPDMGRH